MKSSNLCNEKNNIGAYDNAKSEKRDRGPLMSDMDPKMVQKIQVNREYSKRYRMKQLDRLEKLKKEVKSLEAAVAVQGTRIKFVKYDKSLLQTENNMLETKMSNYLYKLKIIEAQCEKLKKEVEFANLYLANQQQQQLNMNLMSLIHNQREATPLTSYNPYMKPTLMVEAQPSVTVAVPTANHQNLNYQIGSTEPMMPIMDTNPQINNDYYNGLM